MAEPTLFRQLAALGERKHSDYPSMNHEDIRNTAIVVCNKYYSCVSIPALWAKENIALEEMLDPLVKAFTKGYAKAWVTTQRFFIFGTVTATALLAGTAWMLNRRYAGVIDRLEKEKQAETGKMQKTIDALREDQAGILLGLVALRGIGQYPDKSLREIIPGEYDADYTRAFQFATDNSGKFDLHSDPVVQREFIATVHFYTMETGFMMSMNKAFRDTNRDKAKHYFPFVKKLLQAFTLMGKYVRTGKHYRGISVSAAALPMHAEMYRSRVGNRIVFWSLTSTTLRKSVAEQFASAGEAGILYEIDVIEGYNVETLSAHQIEKETLIRSGAVFTVDAVELEGNFLVIKLKQEEEYAICL